jgi:predicted  nucleic acid-binding Zn-ribbon protein
MADAEVIFSTSLDNSQLQKELDRTIRNINSLEEKIVKLGAKKVPLEERLKTIKQELFEARKVLVDMQASPVGTFNKADISEQSSRVRTLQSEYNHINGAVGKINDELQSANIELDAAKEKAGALYDKMGRAAKGAQNFSEASKMAEKRIQGISKRMKSLAASALFFSVITAALTALRKQTAEVIRGNAEASAAIARLKGALLTFAAPILQDIIPALTWLMNLLSAIVTEIMTIAAILTGRSRKSMEAAAKGLYEEADAISATGAAAKKASRQLASFDEINRLTSDSSGGGGVSAIRPDFDLDANPMLEKLSGLFEKINNVFRTIRAGMDIVIDDLKWSFDSKIVPKSKGTWLTAMTALLGATLGASFGGFTGAVIGLTLGAMIGLYITGFDPEYWKNEMGAKEMWTVVIAGLIGAVLGAAFTGIVGAGVGFSLGAVLGLFLVDFAQEEQGGVPELFRELMVVLCALLGIVIGSKVAPGVGTVVGLSIGLAVGLLLYELDKDPKDRSETFRKIGQGIILGLVAGAFGVALAALGVVSTGAAFVISLSIGLILRLFVSEVDDSAVKGYGSKVSLVNPSFTGNISAHSMPTYRSVPALARGAVIPPNREFLAVLGDQRSGTNIETPLATMVQAFKQALAESGYSGSSEAVLMLDRDVLGRVVYQLNKAEGNRIGVSLTGV